MVYWVAEDADLEAHLLQRLKSGHVPAREAMHDRHPDHTEHRMRRRETELVGKLGGDVGVVHRRLCLDEPFSGYYVRLRPLYHGGSCETRIEHVFSHVVRRVG